MARRKSIDVSFQCEKCGKTQRSSAELSSKNFEVFDCHEVCECGGKYVMYMDGEKIG